MYVALKYRKQADLVYSRAAEQAALFWHFDSAARGLPPPAQTPRVHTFPGWQHTRGSVCSPGVRKYSPAINLQESAAGPKVVCWRGWQLVARCCCSAGPCCCCRPPVRCPRPAVVHLRTLALLACHAVPPWCRYLRQTRSWSVWPACLR